MRNNLLQIAILAVILLVSGMSGPAGSEQLPFSPVFPEYPPFFEVDPSWADSVLSELSLEDRIAQMMMVQAYSNMSEAHVKSVGKMISKHHVGGVAFFQGDPLSQARISNQFW